jgi:hypothetical protein
VKRRRIIKERNEYMIMIRWKFSSSLHSLYHSFFIMMKNNIYMRGLQQRRINKISSKEDGWTKRDDGGRRKRRSVGGVEGR